MAANEELLEMLDYALDMLTAELPLIELEYGWTPTLQAQVQDRLKALREASAAGSPPPGGSLVSDLDAAGIREGTLREFCGMVDAALGA